MWELPTVPLSADPPKSQSASSITRLKDAPQASPRDCLRVVRFVQYSRGNRYLTHVLGLVDTLII